MNNETGKTPYFSVLVPVYNTEKYLDDCVSSVLKQGFTDYELLLVDDGSDEKCLSKLDSLQGTDPRVRILKKEHLGLMHTRRYGIQHASGSHIIFLDSDDMLEPDALQTVYGAFEQYRCDGVFYGISRFSGEGYLDEEKLCSEPKIITDKRELYLTCLLDDTYNSLCVKSVLRSVFDGRDYTPYYHIQSGEDLLQSLEILQNCSSVVLLPDVLYRYRQTEESITHIRLPDRYSLEMTIPSMLLDFLKKENAFGKEDYDAFRRVYAKFVLDKVITVCRTAPDRDSRDDMLETVHSCPFCRDFLFPAEWNAGELGSGSFLFRAFRNKQFGLVNLLVKLYDLTVTKCKKLVRNIRKRDHVG